jgi:hypothetical protein
MKRHAIIANATHIVVASVILILLIFACLDLMAQETNEKTRATSAFSQAKFVPDISAILDFSAAGRNLKNAEYSSLHIPGLTGPSGDDEESLNASRGFNFNYGELMIHSDVDPYFELTAIFHLAEEGFETEEAYINTTRLPAGLGLRLGKFKSGFGRLNAQHSHSWDFTDQAIIYRAFFGPEGLDEKGLQLTWTAPLPFYLSMGAEILQGENEASFGAAALSVGSYSDEGAQNPQLGCGFIKTSFDIGKLTLLAGLSGAFGGTRISESDNEALRADTAVLGADLTLRYSIDSYRHISWQSEYLYRNMEGNSYTYDGTDTTKESLRKKQSGFYSQVVWRMSESWRLGVRYEMINLNKVKAGDVDQDEPDNLYKAGVMTDFSPSEFSRFRLQYNYDRSGYIGDDQKTNHEVILQCNMCIGAHGAHSF